MNDTAHLYNLESPSISEGWFSRLWRHRDTIRLLVARDLKVRYKRSVLGFLWTLLNPLITIVIFVAVFSRVFAQFYHQYKLYMICGVLIWNYFSLATAQGMLSVVTNGATIRKIAVPAAVFPAAAILSNFINLIFSLAALAIAFPFVGGRPTISLLWVLAGLPLLLGFTAGLSFLLSAATVFVRDLKNIWDPLLMIWFFLTPVFYPRSLIPPRFYSVLRLNPMLSILEVCRLPIYLGRPPSFGLFMKSVTFVCFALGAGIWAFKKSEHKFVFHV